LKELVSTEVPQIGQGSMGGIIFLLYDTRTSGREGALPYLLFCFIKPDGTF